MNIIFLLIIISLVIAVGFLAAFIWAVKSGQYEDDYTPSVRMLFDDRPVGSKQSAVHSSQSAVGSSAVEHPVVHSSTKTERK